MARKRQRRARRRNPDGVNPRHRSARRRRNPSGLSPRRRTHKRRGRARRHRTPFGLGRGRGIFAVPNLTQALVGVLGGVGTAAILAKLDKPDATGKTKLPALVGKDGKPQLSGYAVRALAGILLGGIAGKVLRKPALGAAWALGAVVITTAKYMEQAHVLGLSGVGDYVTDYYGGQTSGSTQYGLPISGAEYATPDAIGAGDYATDSDLDEITQTPF